MRRRRPFLRLIACLLVVSFGFLVVAPEPAHAGVMSKAGEWARWAIEKIVDGVKWAFNKVKRLLGQEDPTTAGAMGIEGRQEIEKMTKEGEKLLDLEKMMTEREKRLDNLKAAAEGIERHAEFAENMKGDAERLGLKAKDEEEFVKREVGRWEGIMQALEADRAAMQDLVLRALREPVPPACPFLKQKIEESQGYLDRVYTEYMEGFNAAYTNAGTAYLGFHDAWKVWGTIVLASVALIANIVTTLTMVAEFIAFIKGGIALVKAILRGGWKALKWAGSKLQAFFTKMHELLSNRKALHEFLKRTTETITNLFNSILDKLGAILSRVGQKISRAWELLEQGEFRKAWNELTTLKDDVSEAQGLKAAADQAAAQGEQAAASAKDRAKEIMGQYNEATKDKMDFVNTAHDVETAVQDAGEGLDKTEGTAKDYAVETLKAIDGLTLQWEELTGYIEEASQFRREAQEAERKYTEGKRVMEGTKQQILREIEHLSKLLQTECFNNAS